MTKRQIQSDRRILLLEPYYGGSHKRFIDTILPISVDYDTVLADTTSPNVQCSLSVATNSLCSNRTTSSSSSSSSPSKWPRYKFTLYEMSGKKWHWRARTAALYLSRVIMDQADQKYDVLFTSSVLNLAELVALRPDIGRIPLKIIYFHENQLAYPVQHHKERDFQYGYNQILSCLVADQLVFNSKYNRSSLLNNMRTFLKMMPDYRPPDLEQMINTIQRKSTVLYYPIRFSNIPLMHAHRREKKILHIIWPHRWEHDKNPEQFFNILFKLNEERGIQFKVSVLGESYSEVPKIFEEAKTRLSKQIVHWGYVDSKQDYYEVLASGNVCLSTALHEFFGISMLEAAYCGCYPLCPQRLVYPEIFPEKYLYDSDDALLAKLVEFGLEPQSIPLPLDIAYDAFDWIYLKDEYRTLFAGQRNNIPLLKTATTTNSTTANMTTNSLPRQNQIQPTSNKTNLKPTTNKTSSVKSNKPSSASSFASKLKSTLISNHK